MAPPFREAEFELRFDSGINAEAELIDLAEAHGLITKAVAWFELDGDKIAHDRAGAVSYLRDHPARAAALRNRLIASRGEP